MRDQMYQGLIASIFTQPYRQLGTNVFDIRPLKFAIQNGAATIENEFGIWRALLFRVEQMQTNGVIVQLDRTYHGPTAQKVFIHNLMESHPAITPGSHLSTLAFQVEPTEININGSKITFPAYDAGNKPDAKTITKVNEVAKEQAAARIAAAESAREKQEAGRKLMKEQEEKAIAEKKFFFLKGRAATGSTSSQYRLALLYLTGEGTEKNPDEARRLLMQSGDQEYSLAIRKLKELESP